VNRPFKDTPTASLERWWVITLDPHPRLVVLRREIQEELDLRRREPLEEACPPTVRNVP